MFDVEMHWLPRSPSGAGGGGRSGPRRGGRPARPGPRGGNRIEPDVVAAVQRALREQIGDVLVFLPGIGEIRRTETLLNESVGPDVDVFPLAGALSLADQDAALAPSPAGASPRRAVDRHRRDLPHRRRRPGRRRQRSRPRTAVRCPQRDDPADHRRRRAAPRPSSERVGPDVPSPVPRYRLWSKIEHGTRAEHRARDPPGRPRRLRPRTGGLGCARRDDLRVHRRRRPPAPLRRHGDLLADLHAIDAEGIDHTTRPHDVGAAGASPSGPHGGGRPVTARRASSPPWSTNATCSGVDPTNCRPISHSASEP